MKKLILFFFLALALSSCQPDNSDKPGSINVVLNASAYQGLIAKGGIQLVDVRTPVEFAQGHIPGAININVKDGQFQSQVQSQLSTDLPVAVYCRSGKRSADARKILSKMGYNQLYDLKGGYLAWPK
jgi:rhodanese-related sulfurtransferase